MWAEIPEGDPMLQRIVGDGLPCCTPEQAWVWVYAMVELALDLSQDDGSALADAIEHYLQALTA